MLGSGPRGKAREGALVAAGAAERGGLQQARTLYKAAFALRPWQHHALHLQGNCAPGWPASRHSGRSASRRGTRVERAGWPPASTMRPPRVMAS